MEIVIVLVLLAFVFAFVFAVLGGYNGWFSTWTTVTPIETTTRTYIDEQGNEVTETTVVEQVTEYHEEW